MSGWPDDGLAVQLQQQTQHAVGGRVLRPHVEDHAPRRRLERLLLFQRRRECSWYARFAHGYTLDPVTG